MGRVDGWTAPRIRSLRLALQLSQEKFAAKLGTSPKTISNWERGLNPPGLQSRNDLDNVLSTAAPQQRERYGALLGMIRHPADSVVPLTEPDQFVVDQRLEAHREPGGEEATDRRQALRAVGAFAVTAAVPDAVGQSLQLLQELGGSRVGDEGLDHVEASVDRLAHEYFDKPFDQLSRELSGLRQITVALARASSALAERRRLGLMTGYLSGMLGALCLDTGDFAAADAHLDVAWWLASDVQHAHLCSWIRALQSNSAFYSGDPKRAVELSRAGQAVAEGAADNLRLLSYEARAAAKLGDLSSADQAMRHAEALAGRVDVEGPGRRVSDFDLGRYVAATSTSLVWIGQFDRAREHAERAISLFGGPYPSLFTRSIAQVDLALVELHDGHVDRALALGHGVLDAPRGRSVEVRLRELDDELSPLRSSPPVAEFHERVLQNRTPATGSPSRR